VFALAIAAPLALGLAACGGGDSTGSTSTATTATAPRTTGATTTGADHGPSGSSPSSQKGSAGFRTPGGDNSIQNFGDEADAAEVEAANAVLSAYLQVRAKDDWATECTYLAKTTVAPLERLASSSTQLKGKGCAAILAALSSTTPASIRQNTLSGGIASLRVQGNRAFALYHGAKGVDYFVPMVKEDGEWKVGALAPSEFP
jgi:hypothetical protein